MFSFMRKPRRHAAGAIQASTLGDGRRGTQTATFAGGCFWGVEASFREIEGVRATRVGYAGGTVPDPSYEQVCGHATGHAEAVEVTFDPRTVSYEHLVDRFWQIHNPTTLNRQGWDFGDQYRSAIFVHDAEQMTAAVASRNRAQQSLTKLIVTEIKAAGPFYEAEAYHQQYFETQGGGACAVTIEVPTPTHLNRSASKTGLTR
jgi:peptide-methionine (S)-S-oxide reductase